MSIPEFFKGKSVLVTGATGFVGKVFVEKLLRSCPDVTNIYLIMRAKKTMGIEERLQKLIDGVLFSKLKQSNPKVFDKLKAIPGDVSAPRLGINDKDRAEIINNVSIVVNAAASIRFDDDLPTAIRTNLRSAKEIIELIKELKKVDSFVHISTAYCNYEIKHIEEKIYPVRHDWKEVLRLAEESNETIDIMTKKYIEPVPNTYIFTKSIAENLINDLCLNTIPTCILRPSLVVPAIEEPLPGFVDNLTGQGTFYALSSMGVAKLLRADPDNIFDNVFVDNLAKAMIIACKETAVRKDKCQVKIYNTTSDSIYKPLEMELQCKELLWYNPPKYFLGGAQLTITKCTYYYYLCLIFYHIIPALFFDALLKLAGQNISIMKIRRKLHIINEAIIPFSAPKLGSWSFVTKNYEDLDAILDEGDKEQFSICRQNYPRDGTLLKKAIVNFPYSRMYVFPFERATATSREIIRYRIVLILERALSYGFYCVVIYFTIWQINIVKNIMDGTYNFLTRF